MSTYIETALIFYVGFAYHQSDLSGTHFCPNDLSFRFSACLSRDSEIPPTGELNAPNALVLDVVCGQWYIRPCPNCFSPVFIARIRFWTLIQPDYHPIFSTSLILRATNKIPSL